MKKFIFVVNAIELVARLLAGESIEGKTGDTDYGSTWKSDRHLLWREKYPLSMGLDRILTAMEADKNQAQQSVVDDFINGNV